MQQQAIFNRFRSDTAAELLYLPNLTLWYDWHVERGTLPDRWQGRSLPQIAHDLGVPAWLTARPFRVDPGERRDRQDRIGRRTHCSHHRTRRHAD